jgi:hypothetical protein
MPLWRESVVTVFKYGVDICLMLLGESLFAGLDTHTVKANWKLLGDLSHPGKKQSRYTPWRRLGGEEV